MSERDDWGYIISMAVSCANKMREREFISTDREVSVIGLRVREEKKKKKREVRG